MYKQENNNVIIITRTGCKYCEIAKPLLQKIAKEYDLNIYDLNTANFTEEDKDNFLASNEVFQESFGTPYLMIVNNESMIANQQGVTDYEHYVIFLKENQIIQ